MNAEVLIHKIMDPVNETERFLLGYTFPALGVRELGEIHEAMKDERVAMMDGQLGISDKFKKALNNAARLNRDRERNG